MLFWFGLGLLWLGTAASTAFLVLYLTTAKWWGSPVGVSLVAHAAAMAVLFVVSTVLQTVGGPGPVGVLAFAVVVFLVAAEVLQAAVFYRRWWRRKKEEA